MCVYVYVEEVQDIGQSVPTQSTAAAWCLLTYIKKALSTFINFPLKDVRFPHALLFFKFFYGFSLFPVFTHTHSHTCAHKLTKLNWRI